MLPVSVRGSVSSLMFSNRAYLRLSGDVRVMDLFMSATSCLGPGRALTDDEEDQ
jgi:hypothetical protein